LFDFKNLKEDHVAFQNFRTDILEKIAYLVKEKEDFEK
jgi:hypothetical protein